MKKVLCILLSIMLVISLAGCSSDNGKNPGSDKEFKIGVIQLTEHQALDAACDGFVAGLDEAGINYTIDIQNAQGEQTVCATIANKFVNDGVDLILAIATPAAQAATQATSDIPILVTAVTDPESAGLVSSNEKPGNNVSGTSDMNPVEAQSELLLKFVPDAKNIGIMYCSSEDNSILQADMARKAFEKKGLKVTDYTAADSSEVQSVAQSAVGKVDAVYIPTDNLFADTMSSVSMILTPAGIPVVAGESNMVNAGALATYGVDYFKLGKQTAAQAVRILVDGENISEMAIEYAKEDDVTFTVNEEILAELGLEVPADLQ